MVMNCLVENKKINLYDSNQILLTSRILLNRKGFYRFSQLLNSFVS